MNNFSAIVIGGGHAGVEAASMLARKGHRTALVTFDVNKIGAMSCNPAIGGVAKSHLVFEIDALGGWMGACADRNAIQSRRLNLNKGPAVRSTRSQCDKDRYQKTMSTWMSQQENLTLIAGEAAEILYANAENSLVRGLRLKDGTELSSSAVIVTAGTFMRGLMFCGDERKSGGRYGDSAADLLTQSIINTGHRIKRLKTGTPARMDARSIDFSKFETQWGDPELRYFSWRSRGEKKPPRLPQLSCYIGYTNERTHDIIRANFSRSPLFSGDIQGVGPRYCPSVEDKIKRFADRDRHQIFLEPEGLDSNSIYPNGLSTSLPADVQLEFLQSIPGLEQVKLLRPGYAVEYDSIDPTQLNKGFMSTFARGLFFAGQVNRTSGYEEAAAQGLWAGLNASIYIEGNEFLTPDRSRSYLETLADDLVTLGSEEPYRMFTSRSEYRLLLREDNAHERLRSLAEDANCISSEQRVWNQKFQEELSQGHDWMQVQRKRISVDRVLSLYEYLRRPEVSWETLVAERESPLPDEVFERIEVQAKYEGYLKKQEQEIQQLADIKNWTLDPTLSVQGHPSLSKEIVEKFEGLRPKNVLELSRISGMTPSAMISIAKLVGHRPAKEIVSRETEL